MNARAFAFATFADVASHLDVWAAATLDSPDAWSYALVTGRQWGDYSARNQLLLTSYGAQGVVGGAETWRLLPTRDGRPCTVRAGEHGYPVRVPVTTRGSEPDPFLGGVRPTRSAVDRWEWRPVFAEGQLARRPSPDLLTPATVPADLTGPGGAERFTDLARSVAARTTRTPSRKLAGADAHELLAVAAGRLPRSGQRPPLDVVHCRQVAWLVADRVGLTDGNLTAFDPSRLAARERWERIGDVLEPARKLTAALGVALGVDLNASPLPRMTIVDDRVVPAGRRQRLPAASLAQLPIGVWVDVGPYTADEWAQRGEQASGRGAYLRLNDTSYLVALEHGDEAAWRIEDITARRDGGRLADGTARGFAEAKNTALAAVATRLPGLTGRGSVTNGPPPPGTIADWTPIPGRGRSTAEMRRLDDGVTLYVLPGAGARWMPAAQLPDGHLHHGILVASRHAARAAAEAEGRRLVRSAALTVPARLDTVVAELAASSDYTRTELAQLIASRLTPQDRPRLVNATEPGALAELLGAAGITPATIVAVLHAEHVPAAAVGPLLPTIGVPVPEAIRVLHERWQLPRLTAAELLGATAVEMRDAGCPAVEILAARPRDVLRTLPDIPHTWELAAATMLDAGHTRPIVVAHLVAHAPTSEAFAVAVDTVATSTVEAVTLATSYGAPASHLAALSERLGLSPAATGQTLCDAGVTAQVGVETLLQRCDHEPVVAAQLSRSTLNLRTDQILDCYQRAGLDLDDDTSTTIRAARPLSRDPAARAITDTTPARPAVSLPDGTVESILNALPAPDTTGVDGVEALLAAMPPPSTVEGVERRQPVVEV